MLKEITGLLLVPRYEGYIELLLRRGGGYVELLSSTAPGALFGGDTLQR